MTRVVIHIDRLVLTGFTGADPDAFAQGLQQELSRLFATASAGDLQSITGRNVARLDAGSIRAVGQSTPGQLGARAARRISAGLRS
jgi:hypothetical protein